MKLFSAQGKKSRKVIMIYMYNHKTHSNMNHWEPSILNKDVTLDTDSGSESSIEEKHGHSNNHHIYVCHCNHYGYNPYFLMHIPKISRTNILTDTE